MPNMEHAHYVVLFAGLIFGNNPAANDRSGVAIVRPVEASCGALRNFRFRTRALSCGFLHCTIFVQASAQHGHAMQQKNTHSGLGAFQ
jgi:hypothetical protein